MSSEFTPYYPQCSVIDQSEFSVEGALDYNPDSEKYYEEVLKERALPGLIVGGVCLVLALVMVLWSCCLCCIPHRWKNEPELYKIFKGPGCGRCFSFLLVSCIVVFTLLICAMSGWGIQQTIARVNPAVDESFDFIEDTKEQVTAIRQNVSNAVEIGNQIVAVMEVVNEDPVLDDPDVQDIKENLESATQSGKEALQTAEDEINASIDEVESSLIDAVTYRDEGETGSKAINILVITCFAVFIFISVLMGCCSVFGRDARCTAATVVIMWLVLTVAFALGVGILYTVREVSEDTCLFIDEFGVREVKDHVDIDEDRIENLLRYYFQPPSEGMLDLSDLEELWELPLSNVTDFLDLVSSSLFNNDGDLKFPATAMSEDSQEALLGAHELFPDVEASVEFAQDLIAGDTFQVIHKDLKDLLCCTQYDAIESVWIAWVVSAAAGVVLAILVSWQVLCSVQFGSTIQAKPHYTPPPTSAYMRHSQV